MQPFNQTVGHHFFVQNIQAMLSQMQQEGFTQELIAMQARVGQATISRILRGKAKGMRVQTKYRIWQFCKRMQETV